MTDFLPHHPGGATAILRLAGKDGTEEYDKIHPPGLLEANLKPESKLGVLDPSSLGNGQSFSLDKGTAPTTGEPVQLDSLLSLDDIESAATRVLDNAAWAYYYSASDYLISKQLNNAAFRAILLRPRIFVDCENVSTATRLLGLSVGLPVFICPAAMARLAHPTGEAGIARACGRFQALQVISNNASMTPEDIVRNSAPGQVFGWQLYVQVEREKSEAMLARINRLADKIRFVCLTLDAPTPGKREHDEKSKGVASNLPVTSAVRSRPENNASTSIRPRQGGIGQQLFMGTSPKLTWENTLPWLAQHTSMPIVLKGIQTHEDAYMASLHAPQVKAIILSNHGGRQLDTAPPAVHTLLEIRKYCPEVFQRVEVWVDGGIKRGTDVVKALCLGARGVGIGRAALWGLGVGGPEGVTRTLESGLPWPKLHCNWFS